MNKYTEHYTTRCTRLWQQGRRDAWLRLLLHLSDAAYEAIHTLKIRPSYQVQSITVVITVFGHNGTDLHQNSMDLCDTHTPIHPQNHLVFPSAGSSSVSPHRSMKDTMKIPPVRTIAMWHPQTPSRAHTQLKGRIRGLFFLLNVYNPRGVYKNMNSRQQRRVSFIVKIRKAFNVYEKVCVCIYKCKYNFKYSFECSGSMRSFESNSKSCADFQNYLRPKNLLGQCICWSWITWRTFVK